MPEIIIRDIFDDLKEENNRLYYELIFAEKNINHLENYRKLCSKLIDNYECFKNSEIKTLFNNLENNYQTFLVEEILKTNNKVIVIQNNNKLIENEIHMKANDVNDENVGKVLKKVISDDMCFDSNKSIENFEPKIATRSQSSGNRSEFQSSLAQKKYLKPNIKSNECSEPESKASFKSIKMIDRLERRHDLNKILVTNKNDTKNLQNTKTGKLVDNDYDYETESESDSSTDEKFNIKIHVCDWPACNASFGNKFKLKRHYRGHTGEKPFLCQWIKCGKRYKTKSQLKSHLFIHFGRKFGCDRCGKSYTRKYKLIKHKYESH